MYYEKLSLLLACKTLPNPAKKNNILREVKRTMPMHADPGAHPHGHFGVA